MFGATLIVWRFVMEHMYVMLVEHFSYIYPYIIRLNSDFIVRVNTF